MAANLRDPVSIPGGDRKRFQDSSNYVFHIVGECFSSAAGTHLATDLTCKEALFVFVLGKRVSGGPLVVGDWIVDVINLQKIFGLNGLKGHIMEIREALV